MQAQSQEVMMVRSPAVPQTRKGAIARRTKGGSAIARRTRGWGKCDRQPSPRKRAMAPDRTRSDML
ncbi:MAG: hypothetical protein AB4352_17205 [Hormoscilla sp.]